MLLLSRKSGSLGLKTYRDLDSVGAVGATAPTHFEESYFRTLAFHTNIPLAIVFEAYLKIYSHSFEILTRSLSDDLKTTMKSYYLNQKETIIMVEIKLKTSNSQYFFQKQ